MVHVFLTTEAGVLLGSRFGLGATLRPYAPAPLAAFGERLLNETPAAARRDAGASEQAQAAAAVTAETLSTAGQAPICGASTCEATNAARPTPVSAAAVRGPSRLVQMRAQHSPPAASTTPPRGREPVPAATA
jgi:hypothetical protein